MEDYNFAMKRMMRNPCEYHHDLGMNYTLITDNLIVGSHPQNPEDIDHLKKEEGVTYILNLQQDNDVEYWGIDLKMVSRTRCLTYEEAGIAYLHAYKANKSALVHQNISAEKVLVNQRYNPPLSDSGLYKLLTNDIIFSALKASAAKGYLAPEYTTTGKFTEKSDVYAFGVLLFQILTGKQKMTSSIRLAVESFKFEEFIDPNLHGRFFEYEAAKLAKMALLCSHESPFERPTMEAIVQELSNCSSCL